MQKVGLVDIGSNTIVLLIYKITEDTFEIIHHESEPVHLVSYSKDGHMDNMGIEKACEVLKQYRKILDSYSIQDGYGFITEPWRRIDNDQEMIQAFTDCGFEIHALTGEEEATYDFLGSRIDTNDIASGIAFDVGGGSSEFIRFENQVVCEAQSIPYGCVRLKQLPLNKETVDKPLQQMVIDYPKLSTTCKEIIGIGGTVRAAGKVCEAIFGTSSTMSIKNLEDIYTKLENNDPSTTEIMHEVVSKGRWEVFLPGLNMVLGIAHLYHAETIRISSGCVREGFLMRVILKTA